MEEKMRLYYHTFGIGHPYKDCVVVIRAANATRAHKTMFMIFGRKWAFQYTESQWAETLKKGYYQTVTYFPTIDAVDVDYED